MDWPRDTWKLVVLATVMGICLAACAPSDASPTAGLTRPVVTIDEPADGSQVVVGQSVAIQYLLTAHGCSLAADGTFGTQTETAVKKFQQVNGLPPDGVVGPNTWTALVKGHTVQEGSSGADVQALQHLLRHRFSYGIAVDGAFGAKTGIAVREFQTSRSLAVNGVVGLNTWKALVADQ